MKNKWKYVILINILVFIAYSLYAVYKKEQILKDGKLVLLKLAPVDPRSLMQGDYMILNYEISNNIPDNTPQKGYVILEELNNGSFKALKFQNYLDDLDENQIAVEFTKVDHWMTSIKIGAESYFFQEGDAEKYQNAVYGGLRVDDKGNSILVGLFDENKNKIN